eukprot:scaffold230752_cov28-Tisochrysis_lutea.AAC.3
MARRLRPTVRCSHRHPPQRLPLPASRPLRARASPHRMRGSLRAADGAASGKSAGSRAQQVRRVVAAAAAAPWLWTLSRVAQQPLRTEAPQAARGRRPPRQLCPAPATALVRARTFEAS